MLDRPYSWLYPHPLGTALGLGCHQWMPAWCVQELGMVMHACKPSTLEVRARRSEVCGQPEKDPFLPRMTLNLIFSWLTSWIAGIVSVCYKDCFCLWSAGLEVISSVWFLIYFSCYLRTFCLTLILDNSTIICLDNILFWLNLSGICGIIVL